MADLLFYLAVCFGAFVVGAIAATLLFGIPLLLLIRRKGRHE